MLQSPVIIAAESSFEREQWMSVLNLSSRMQVVLFTLFLCMLRFSFFFTLSDRTFKNAELGDSMIKQLEDLGLQMAKEKQDYMGG